MATRKEQLKREIKKITKIRKIDRESKKIKDMGNLKDSNREL